MVNFVNKREEREEKERLYDQLVRITTEKAGYKITKESRPHYFRIDGRDITIKVGIFSNSVDSSDERETPDNYKESLGYKLACMLEEETGEPFRFVLSKRTPLDEIESQSEEMIKFYQEKENET